MSYRFDTPEESAQFWRDEARLSGLVDCCDHGVPDDRHEECELCAAEDAIDEFVKAETTAILPMVWDTRYPASRRKAS